MPMPPKKRHSNRVENFRSSQLKIACFASPQMRSIVYMIGFVRVCIVTVCRSEIFQMAWLRCNQMAMSVQFMMPFYIVNMAVTTIYSPISRLSCLGVTKRWIVLVSIASVKKQRITFLSNSRVNTQISLAFLLPLHSSVVFCRSVHWDLFFSCCFSNCSISLRVCRLAWIPSTSATTWESECMLGLTCILHIISQTFNSQNVCVSFTRTGARVKWSVCVSCAATHSHLISITHTHRSKEFKVHETYLEVFTFQQTDRHSPENLLFQFEKIKCNKRQSDTFSPSVFRRLVVFFYSPARLSALS